MEYYDDGEQVAAAPSQPTSNNTNNTNNNHNKSSVAAFEDTVLKMLSEFVPEVKRLQARLDSLEQMVDRLERWREHDFDLAKKTTDADDHQFKSSENIDHHHHHQQQQQLAKRPLKFLEKLSGIVCF